MKSKKNLKTRVITAILLLFLFSLIIKFSYILVFSLLIFSIMGIIEFNNLLKRINIHKFLKLIFNVLFIIYVFLFSFLFFFFSNFIHLKIILFSILVGCVASDIGGYVFGNLIKGPKLTKVSPNKTISGSIGSIILSMISTSSIFFYLTNKIDYKIFIIGFIVSIACQLGDLFFSYLKRKAKLKDTGNFLPGHGGVLDRIDGILTGIPIGFITLITLFR